MLAGLRLGLKGVLRPNARPSARTFAISSSAFGPPLPQVFRRAPVGKTYTEAKNEIVLESNNKKLTPEVSSLCWIAIAERWPLEQLVLTLSEPPSLSRLIPPLETVQLMRDVARRFLANFERPNKSLSSLRHLEAVLGRFAPDDPFNLFLLLFSYIAISDKQAIDRTSAKIRQHIEREGKWTFYSQGPSVQKPGDENWGLKREIRRRVSGEDGALELMLCDVKATIEALDRLILNGKAGEAGTDVLDWFSRVCPPANERFHRTRLIDYLEPLITTPSFSLPFPLLNIFLKPALVHQGSDPLVVAYALQSLQILVSSPSSTPADQEAARAAFYKLLSTVDTASEKWTPMEHREHIEKRLPRTNGSRVREAFAIDCLKRLVEIGMMTEVQKGLWNVVFDWEDRVGGSEGSKKASKEVRRA